VKERVAVAATSDFPLGSIKNVVAQSVTQYPRLPSTLPTHATNSHGIEKCSFPFLM
jgi:hypothetical protein